MTITDSYRLGNLQMVFCVAASFDGRVWNFLAPTESWATLPISLLTKQHRITVNLN